MSSIISNKAVKKHANTLKRLLSYTRPYRVETVFAFIFTLLSVALTLLAPILIGRTIDCFIGVGDVDYKSAIFYMVALALSVLASALFKWISSVFINKVAYNTIRDIRVEAFKHLNDLPLQYIDTHSHGDITARIVTDIDLISDGLIQGFMQFFTGIVTIITTIGFMFAVNWFIAIVVIVLTPISLLFAAMIAKRSNKLFRAQSMTRGEMSGFINETLGNQKIVKAFSHEGIAEADFDRINRELYKTGVRSQFISAVVNPATRFVNALVYVAVGITGAFCVMGSFQGIAMTIGQLSSFLAYANQYTKPFNEITGVMSDFQTALAAANRVFKLLDEPQQSDDSLLMENVNGSTVQIENVSFSYRKDKPLIENLNLDVARGRKVAIVGPTGSGKTTIINLLMRFYDVDEGAIKIDGVDIRDMKRSAERSQFGMVLQETWLFKGTIADNIAYGRPDASMQDIIAAAKEAHADSFITQLKDGYNTIISGENGNLSEGQKQLLCIARVMLIKPPMLILDEATSSIDTRTEMKIQQAFGTLMDNKTAFIVAHRLSTIREADIILVMNDGQIVEQGNHESLIANGGYYAKLYESQYRLTQ